jgi:hypothetical protein
MKPQLIHPRDVQLHRRLSTEEDSELGKTGKIEWNVLVTLAGQVRYAKFNQLVPTGGGNDPIAEGHVVFMANEWVKHGGKVGDEMVLAPSDSRLVILEVRPAAHYQGRAWQVHVLFYRKRAGAK